MTSFLESTWSGIDWSPWIALEEASRDDVPEGSGVYRVRVTGQPVLAYIGQTGRLRARLLRELAPSVLRDQMPWNDPHTAAPALWAYRIEEGMSFEISAASLQDDMPLRRGVEDLLLWRYRLEQGRSPFCNHGHFHPSFQRPSNRSEGRVMRRLVVQQRELYAESSAPPLTLAGKPHVSTWMGLTWSLPNVVKSLTNLPGTSALYKVIASDGYSVDYIGETSALRQRLASHGRSGRFLSSALFSYHLLPEVEGSIWRREWESDLLGAYFHQRGYPPALQYGQSSNDS